MSSWWSDKCWKNANNQIFVKSASQINFDSRSKFGETGPKTTFVRANIHLNTINSWQQQQYSVLFFSCPWSEGWPHHGRTVSSSCDHSMLVSLLWRSVTVNCGSQSAAYLTHRWQLAGSVQSSYLPCAAHRPTQSTIPCGNSYTNRNHTALTRRRVGLASFLAWCLSHTHSES